MANEYTSISVDMNLINNTQESGTLRVKWFGPLTLGNGDVIAANPRGKTFALTSGAATISLAATDTAVVGLDMPYIVEYIGVADATPRVLGPILVTTPDPVGTTVTLASLLNASAVPASVTTAPDTTLSNVWTAATVAEMQAFAVVDAFGVGIRDGDRCFVKSKGIYRAQVPPVTAAVGLLSVTSTDGRTRWVLEEDAQETYRFPFFNAKLYGCVGDGTTDDYEALQNLAAAVTAAGKGTVYFPPGTYYIGQYRITAGASVNTVADITFTSCNGITIAGHGAKLDVRGNFNRQYDAAGPASYRNAVSPLKFVTCSNVTIEGLEVDGNVDQMTRDTIITIAGTWAAADTATALIDGTTVNFVAVGSSTADIATGLAAAINANATVAAKVTAVANDVTSSVIRVTPDNTTANYAVTASETTAGNGTATAEGVIESGIGLVWLLGCTDVTLRDLYLHHSMADGLKIAAASGTTASKRVMVDRVRNEANARQGMSVTGGWAGTFTNCDFNTTGWTNAAGTALGAYGYHAPGSGVDIEPTDANDVITGEIEFIGCRVKDNVRGFIAAQGPALTTSVRFIGGLIDQDARGGYVLLIGAGDVQILDSVIKCGSGSIYPIWQTRSDTYCRIAGCTIYGTGDLVICVDQSGKSGQRSVIENNSFIGQHASANGGNLLNVNSHACVIRNNYLFAPRALHDGTTWTVAADINNCVEVSGNVWDTDLVDPEDWFYIDYTGVVGLHRERLYNSAGYDDRAAWATGQTYAAGIYRTNAGITYRLLTAGGSTTSVAPTHVTGTVTGADGYAWAWVGDGTRFGLGTSGNPNLPSQTVWDATVPYGKEPVATEALVLKVAGSTATSMRMTAVNNAAPTTGRHGKGDLFWNYNPSASGTRFWACTVGGWFADAGTWTGGTAEVQGAIILNAAGRVYRVVAAGAGNVDAGGATEPTQTTFAPNATDLAGYSYQYIASSEPTIVAESLAGSDTWNPGSIADGDMEAKDITVAGAALGDFALVSFSLDVTDLTLTGTVTAANTVTAVLANNTGGAVVLASGTIRARVLKAV